MYSNNREAYRLAFFEAWDKFGKKLPLNKVESQIVEVILSHPEYHRFLSKHDQHQQFEIEENPFFHLGLHISIQEQIQMDWPKGVLRVYEKLLAQGKSAHDAEHEMMTCIAKMLWEAEMNGGGLSDAVYLSRLEALV